MLIYFSTLFYYPVCGTFISAFVPSEDLNLINFHKLFDF